MNVRIHNSGWEKVSPSSTKVMIVVAEGVSLTTIASTLEPFQFANTLLEQDRFSLQFVSLSNHDPVTMAGIPIPCQTTSKEVLAHHDVMARPDLVILCCGQSLNATDLTLLNAFTRKLARVSVPVFATGAANSAIATAGIIKSGKCAAHWKTSAALIEKFPNIEFANILFASNGRATSCAGEFSTFDLIVEFIHIQCGCKVASAICNHFLANGRRSGVSVQLLNGDAMICKNEKFQHALKIMIDNIEAPISTARIAVQVGVSRRQIERIFSLNGFEPPNKYYKNLRLTRAYQLMEQTDMSLTEIALACGFENISSFSKCYKQTFGVTPKVGRENLVLTLS